MLTVNAIYDAITAAMQRAQASDNTADLTELQLLSGYLMNPAEHVGDRETMRRFQTLAARIANAREAIEQGREDW